MDRLFGKRNRFCWQMTETHGTGVLLKFLNKEKSKWHLKFTLQNEDATWALCKQKLIAELDSMSSKKSHPLFDRNTTGQTVKDYVEQKTELWSKFFPCLSCSDLNLIALTGLDEKSIKALKSHKSSEKENFVELCKFYSILDEPQESTSS